MEFQFLQFVQIYTTNQEMILLCFILEMEQIMHLFITQSKIVSENIKWNLNIKCKKINSLLVNTRNANAFTGSEGYKGLKEIAEEHFNTD